MACRVFDKVFKGFSGQLIGTFTIPIGEIMVAQREDYEKNCQMLDKLINDLEDVIEGKVVLDYEPVNKNVDSKFIDDKKFREDQRKEKQKYSKVMEEKKEVKKPISERMLDKIAPEPAKPTAVLEKKLEDNKKDSLKQKLIVNESDDDDEDEDTANIDSKKTGKSYVPPALDIAAINDSQAHNMDALHRTPRSALSGSQKEALNREAVLDAIS